MSLTPSQQQLKDQFFTALLEASLPLKAGPDPEVALEMLIETVQTLKEHFEQELEELRQEQVD